MGTIERGRRTFIATAGATLLVAATGRAAEADEKVAPGEDLMREHGVLRRVMLVYDEAVRRLAARETLPLDSLAAGADIIRHVIEDYHERLEEDFLFPRFEKARKLTDLVTTLRVQHKAGRGVTAEVLKLTHGPLAEANRKKLSDLLHAFTRMYRPHAAREDTVLFPAFHALVGEKAYGELGEQFEDKEQSVLGKGGFEKAVEEVGRLEAAFGIHDLARFTP
jgi:hemerythrin-like domain-containing protein